MNCITGVNVKRNACGFLSGTITYHKEFVWKMKNITKTFTEVGRPVCPYLNL